VEYAVIGCEGEAVVLGFGGPISEIEELIASRSGQVCDPS
jgi:hypothetical protein